MLDITIQWIALLGLVIIGALFVIEVRRWRSFDRVISRPQKIIRVCLIVLIEALFIMMFLGPWITTRQDPVGALVYWTICAFLALAVVVLALMDLRHVFKGYSSFTREMFSDILSSPKGRGEDRRDK